MSLIYEYMFIYSDERQGLREYTLERLTVSLMCMFLPREKIFNAILFCLDGQYFIFSQKVKGFRLHSAKTNNGKQFENMSEMIEFPLMLSRS